MLARTAGLIVALASVTVLAAQQPAPEPADAMYAAIRSGDTSKVAALLQGGADANGRDRRGGATPLMHAAAVGSLDTMRLLLDKGADVNGKSAGSATALMWAVADIAKVRLLLERGADVNVVTETGRTALLLAAMSDESAETVRLLLAKGANPKAVDAVNVTALWSATFGDDTATVRQLIDAGIEVNAADKFIGSNPLLNAAQNGNLEVVRLLLSKGANPNATTGPPSQPVKNGLINLGLTSALSFAATGPADVVKALLDAGGNPRHAEARGMTPLMLATATDHGDLEAIRLLIPLSDLGAKDAMGETALDWAEKSGPTKAVALLKAASAPAAHVAARPADGPSASPAPVAHRVAVDRSVALLERATGNFFVNGACGACHAQNVTDFATMAARKRGVHISDEGAAQRAAGAAAAFGATATRLLERQDPPAVDILLYTLGGLAAFGYPPDRATDAMMFNTVAQQRQGGNWHIGGIARPPIEDGDFTRTALGVRALKVYAPPGRGEEMRGRTARAMAWLTAATPLTTEDRAFRLLGLAWGGADRTTIGRAASELVSSQRRDGGWAQREEMESDAYGTGLALTALLESGAAPAGDGAVQRGAAYLLSTQRADGSWFVRSRAPKFQPYFEGGFPYGHNQWISSMATGWATSALSLSLDAPAANVAAAGSAPR